MGVSEEKPDEQLSAAGKTSERYFGSVRFFKHMILIMDAALIIIPTAAFIILLVRYGNLKSAYQEMGTKYAECSRQLEELREERRTAVREADQGMQETIGQAAAPAQEEVAGQELIIPFSADPEEWKFLLLNDTHPLEREFTMVLADTRNGKKVDARIRAPLEKMIDAAQKAGHELVICSAYRDYEKQEELVTSSIQKYMESGMNFKSAFYKTKKQIALTGTSEHHTGLAVDIVGIAYQSLDIGQGKTEEAQWLAEHACEYGFILRYPANKEKITGISYEPWHFRYVGEEAAEFMREYDLCLEEFLDLVKKQRET